MAGVPSQGRPCIALPAPQEKTDGAVLGAVLRCLPGLLQDRAVVLCAQLSLRRLASWLYAHVSAVSPAE